MVWYLYRCNNFKYCFFTEEIFATGMLTALKSSLEHSVSDRYESMEIRLMSQSILTGYIPPGNPRGLAQKTWPRVGIWLLKVARGPGIRQGPGFRRAGGAGQPLRPWSDQKSCHLWSKPCNFSVQVGPIILRLRFFSNGRTNLDLLPPLLFRGK